MLLAAILVLTAVSLPASAKADKLAAYRHHLGSITHDLESALSAEQASPGSSREILAGLEKRLSTDTNWMRKGLGIIRRSEGKSRAVRIADLLAEVRAYQAAAQRVPANSPESLTKAKSMLDDILSKSQYKRTWLDNLVIRIGEVWRKMLSSINVSENTIDLMSWVVLAIVVVAFAILLVMLALRLVAHFSNRKIASGDAIKAAATYRKRQSLESLLAQAEQHAAAGRYRDAFRAVYLASLFLLDRARLITYSDSGTNWEYLRALRSQGAAEKTDAFQGMTFQFDRHIYGKRPVSEDDYLACLRRYRELEAAA